MMMGLCLKYFSYVMWNTISSYCLLDVLYVTELYYAKHQMIETAVSLDLFQVSSVFVPHNVTQYHCSCCTRL